jgi:hypothetical protein
VIKSKTGGVKPGALDEEPRLAVYVASSQRIYLKIGERFLLSTVRLPCGVVLAGSESDRTPNSLILEDSGLQGKSRASRLGSSLEPCYFTLV